MKGVVENTCVKSLAEVQTLKEQQYSRPEFFQNIDWWQTAALCAAALEMVSGLREKRYSERCPCTQKNMGP